MRTTDQSSPQWVIKEVTYFDHAAHRFVMGDIEIDGERIGAIAPPGRSGCERAIDARGCVCTPGLVKAQTDSRLIADESESLLREGVTTAGTLCASASECTVAASRSSLHVVARLMVNALARVRSEARHPDAGVRAAELRALARIEAVLRGSGARLALAVHCPSIASAYELLYAQNIAAALSLELGFELSDDDESARAFRERFYRSETHLLAFLQLLRPGVSVWGRSQLTRSDVETLVQFGADVIGLNAASILERRTPGGCRACVRTCASGTRLAALAGISAVHADADMCVDAATVAAAAALGERTCGRIAPGMRADLCLFSSLGRHLIGLGSEAFVELFERGRPDSVIVAGATTFGAPLALHAPLRRASEQAAKHATTSPLALSS